MSPDSSFWKRKKLLALILVFLLLLIAGGSAYYWFFLRKAGEDEGGIAEKGEQLKGITLNSFTVNLADPGYRRYLRTTIALEYTGKEKVMEKELGEKEHRVRDAIIGVLRSKTVADINNPDKTVQLRQELVEAVNRVLEKNQIKDIYFRDFIIQ
ncbi:MAG: flagellar basal body-associated FliL family protein [Bacillota bacterium]